MSNKIVNMPARAGKTFSPRTALIAKIHVAKKQMAMEDDSYRAMLRRVTGKDSSADLSMGQMESVIKEFERLGFTGAVRRTKPGGLPSEPQAKLIRALWLNLYHLGELREQSEAALLSYCRRMSGVESIEWMHAEEFDNVIRGLRGWLQRVDWENPTAQVISSIAYERSKQMLDANIGSTNYSGIAAKAATIRAQYHLLNLDIGGFCPELMAADEMDLLIETLGTKCRAAKAAKGDI